MTRIVLNEFKVSEPVSISKDEIPGLQARLKNLVEILYDFEGVRLKATANVGYIPVNRDIQLVVLPKVHNISDFFYILQRAGVSPSLWLDEGILASSDKGQHDGIPEFLIRMLLYKLRILKRDGFYRHPIERIEMRSSPKGKIDVAGTVRYAVLKGRNYETQCRYYEDSRDNLENRFIKYTLYRLLRTEGLPSTVRKELRDNWRLFGDIPLDVREWDLQSIERIIRRRLVPVIRSYYLDILSICYLIVGNSTVLLKAGDEIRLSAFAIKMDDVFEKYIRAVLVRALEPKLNVLDGNKDRRKLFCDSVKPEITPDIMIYKGSVCVGVADTKYKDKALPSVDDWYQIISYCLALAVPNGVLIHASSEPKPPQAFHIGDKVVWVYYFCLNNPRAEEEGLVGFIENAASVAAAGPPGG